MKKLFLLLSIASASSFADCSFEITNHTAYPVTLQGYFIENGDKKSSTSWITVKPNSSVTQVRSSKDSVCNSSLKYSGSLATKVELKNKSGYWIGNKGIFSADQSYASLEYDKSLADNDKAITLSNGVEVNENKFRVAICNEEVDSDDCAI